MLHLSKEITRFNVNGFAIDYKDTRSRKDIINLKTGVSM